MDDKIFSSTIYEDTIHVNFELTIPKSYFTNENKANFYLLVGDSEAGWSYYPTNSVLFDSTFEIKW